MNITEKKIFLKEKIGYFIHWTLMLIPSLLIFVFFLILLHPCWISKQLEIRFNYISNEPFKLSIALDRSGDLFCPEKLIVREFFVPASPKSSEYKQRISVAQTTYIGMYMAAETTSSAVTLGNFSFTDRSDQYNVDLKKIIFQIDLEQKSLKFDPDKRIIFSSGSKTELHVKSPGPLRAFLTIHYVFLFYSILVSMFFSALIFKLCRKIKTEKRTDVLFVTAGIFLLGLPVVRINYFEKLSDENRLFYQFPAFIKNQEINRNYPKEFESWLNDRIFGREKMIGWNDSVFGMTWLQRLYSAGTKNHPDNEFAFWGKDQWMFTSVYNGINSVLNKNRFSEEELRTCAAQLTMLEKVFKDRYNAPVYIVIAPDKETIYEDFYPDFLLRRRVHHESRLKQLLSYLQKNTTLKVSCATDALLAAKKQYPMYYKAGTHWTARAGMYAAKDLMKMMKKDFSHIDETFSPVKSWKPEKNSDIDIARMLKYKDPMNELPPEFVTYDFPTYMMDIKKEQIDIDYLLSLIRNKYTFGNPRSGKRGLRMLAVTDSFGSSILPHLYPYVTDVYQLFYGHGKDFVMSPFESEITKFNPNLVVIETTERFLHRFLTIKFED